MLCNATLYVSERISVSPATSIALFPFFFFKNGTVLVSAILFISLRSFLKISWRVLIMILEIKFCRCNESPFSLVCGPSSLLSLIAEEHHYRQLTHVSVRVSSCTCLFVQSDKLAFYFCIRKAARFFLLYAHRACSWSNTTCLSCYVISAIGREGCLVKLIMCNGNGNTTFRIKIMQLNKSRFNL